MSRKEKYLSVENFESEINHLLDEIQKSGVKDREFQIKGNSALLVTDMQEYFLSPDAHACIPSAEAILPNILNLIDHFTENQHPVIYTQHLNNDTNAGNMKTWWNDMIDESSPFFSLSPLLPSPNRTNVQSRNPSTPFHPFTSPLILQKFQYDAFHNTDLEKILKENNINTLIICGVMTNLCCETTLRTAFVKGFNTLMPVDATATYKKGYHISTFVNLSFGFCPVKTTEEILDLISR